MAVGSLMPGRQVARVLGVTPHTLIAWRRAGLGPPYVPTRGGPRYRISEVLRWQEERRRIPAPGGAAGSAIEVTFSPDTAKDTAAELLAQLAERVREVGPPPVGESLRVERADGAEAGAEWATLRWL